MPPFHSHQNRVTRHGLLQDPLERSRLEDVMVSDQLGRIWVEVRVSGDRDPPLRIKRNAWGSPLLVQLFELV
jgi:hypothetical protein